jgi:enoyl-CoA hydratase
VDRHFSHARVCDIEESLASDDHPLAVRALHDMSQRSPLMMAVALEQIRRARTLPLADCLRIERDLVRNCFHIRPGVAGETVEGIRALAIDKDRKPHWYPTRSRDVTESMVKEYFVSPWPVHAHPLRQLTDVMSAGPHPYKTSIRDKK